MDKILHDLKDPKLWELCIFLIMGNAGFCPSTIVKGLVQVKWLLNVIRISVTAK